MNTTELINQAVMGTSEAIEEVAKRLDQASPAEVANAVEERLRFRRAADAFQAKYRDVMTDPNLKQLALQRDSELAASQPELDYSARLELVGSEIRDWMKKLSAGRKVTAEENSATRQRQHSASNRPARSVEWDISDGDPEDAAAEQIIDAMARARGQDHAIRHRWGKHHLPNADE